MITLYFFSISGAKLSICSCNLIAKTFFSKIKKNKCKFDYKR